MSSRLIINHPELIVSKNVARVNCDITEASPAGEEAFKRTVTFDVENQWGKYLVTENINAYLIGCLPYAMRNQMDIELLAPVSSELLHNFELFLIPHLVKYDSRLYPTKIHANHIEYTNLKNADAVGTGMSTGVDSFFTVHQYIDPKYKDHKLTHLFVEQVGDLLGGILNTKYKRNINKLTVDKVSHALNLPVVYAYSNFRQLFRMIHVHTHTFISMFYVHMLAKLFRLYFYSSAGDFSQFSLVNNSIRSASYYELLSLQALSTNSLKLISGGAASDRIEKTKKLADNHIASNFLRVCLVEEFNCMKCWKCRRELLTLDMQGNLDKFKKIFDIPTYQKNKEEYLKWLIKLYHSDRKVLGIKELYDFFHSSEQDTMERLENWCLEEYEPMKSPGYYCVHNKIQKVDPSTGKSGWRYYKKGEIVYFVDYLYINGVCFLRSKMDSHQKKDRAVLKSALSKIRFKPMKKPRYLKTIRNVTKINPYTGIGNFIKKVEAGTLIYFVDTITVNGVQYLRTRHDSQENRSLAIPRDCLVEAKNVKSLPKQQ